MIALVTYIKLSAFEKEGTIRDPSGCRAEGCADRLGRLLLLLAIHSGVPSILSTETRKKKLAEEG
jgi:hypothetical protein